MTLGDTPDNQVGVVNAQQLLATVASGTANATVTVPTNSETLVVQSKVVAASQPPEVTGVASGFKYPGVQIRTGVFPNIYGVAYFDVSTAVDAEYAVHFPEAPAATWYVYADDFGHVTIEPATAGTTGRLGGEAPPRIMQVGGEGGGKLYPLEVNTLGSAYIIPTVPSIVAGDHPTVEVTYVLLALEATGVIVAAPGASKRIRVFGAQLASKTANQFVYLRDATTTLGFACVVGGNSTPAVLPAQGLPLSVNSAMEVVFYEGVGKVLAAFYYTIENV
jgi:hypothetical protein